MGNSYESISKTGPVDGQERKEWNISLRPRKQVAYRVRRSSPPSPQGPFDHNKEELLLHATQAQYSHLLITAFLLPSRAFPSASLIVATARPSRLYRVLRLHLAPQSAGPSRLYQVLRMHLAPESAVTVIPFPGRGFGLEP